MPESTVMPEYDEIADVLWRLGVMQSPSELQGYLAGQLAVGATLNAGQWLQQTQDLLDPVGELNESDRRQLLDMFSGVCSQIRADDMCFELLLPDETIGLRQRVESLSQWCQGFLAGFALAGKVLQQQKGQQYYSADVSELLSDIAGICQAASDDGAEDEAAEQDFFIISEYLRVAVITIYFECHSTRGITPGSDNTIAFEASGATTPEQDKTASALQSPAALFNKKTLH